jgi:hypothetical protein
MGIWHKLGPWLTPCLIVVEVALVWSGLLRVGTAIMIGIGIEAVVLIVAVTRAVFAVRRFSAQRSGGATVWSSLEDGLAALVPPTAARVIVGEIRLFGALLAQVFRRGANQHARSYSYHASARTLTAVILGLLIFESLVVELILVFTLSGTPWPWILLGLHVYAILWMLALRASMSTRPHTLESDGVHIRDGVFTDVVIPYPSVRNVKIARSTTSQGMAMRTGLKIDPGDRSAVLAYGQPNVTIAVDPTARILLNGRPTETPFDQISITVDQDPQRFVDDLVASSPAGGASGEVMA